MSISVDEICNKFTVNQELNFIGLAITVHQAHGIDVCIAQLKKMGIVPKGFVLICSHKQTGRGLNKDFFYNLTDDISVENFEYQYNHIKNHGAFWGGIFAYKSALLNKFNRQIFIASPDVNSKWINLIEQNVEQSKVISIIIDDGAGSYMDPYHKFLNAQLRNYASKCKLRLMFITRIRTMYLDGLTKMLISNGRIIDNRIFLKTNESGIYRFSRNKNISEFYDALFRKISNSIPHSEVCEFEGKVVINTQCLKENNIINNDLDFKIYTSIVKQLRESGIPVVIKPHPREKDVQKYKRFGCSVYNNSKYSQESIIATTRKKPLCIISIMSSTLLNTYGIFGIPVISLAKLFQDEGSVDNNFKQQLGEFIELYNEIFIFPRNISELTETIVEMYKSLEK